EQIITHAAGTPLADDAVDDLVQRAYPPKITPTLERRQLQDHLPHAHPRILPNERLESTGDHGHLGPEIDSEQCPRCDRQGRLHHLTVDVDLIAITPAIRHSLG